ncbi:MAG: hypothetical protein ACKVVT_03570 [Dehalococcoidia bacterium]
MPIIAVAAVALVGIVAAAAVAFALRGGSDDDGGSPPAAGDGGGPSVGGGGSPPAQAALTALDCEPGTGTAYEVGENQSLRSLGEVPWEKLAAGDTVRIHWRAEPYREKFMIRGQGTADAPIVVCGVAGPKGELPVIDGKDAITPAGLGTPFSGNGEPRGLIHLTVGRNDTWGYKPQYIVIQGLHIRNAFHEYTFTNAAGKKVAYSENAAGIFVERGEHITVRGVELEGNGNGFFVASGDSEEVLSRDILLERSRIFGNGTVKVAADRHHNIYTEAVGMVFQFNDIGPLRSGSMGSALKDRSAGTIIRYNRIEGGARTLDLVDAQESWVLTTKLPEYRRTLVYGNLMINGPVGASNMVHYGGDSGLPEINRKGTLYFYNNTIVVRANLEGPNARYRTALFDAETSEETIEAWNNIIDVRPATSGSEATQLTWMRHQGTLKLGLNWATPGMFEWRDDKAPPQGGISGLNKVIGDKAGPGFVDEGSGDYAIASGASAAREGEDLRDVPRSLGAALDFQYVHPASGQERAGDAGLGAFPAGGAASTGSAGSTPPPASASPAAGSSSGSGASKSGPIDFGSARPNGWSGSLQYLGKGPNGHDNGKRSDCTGAGSGTPAVLCVRAGASRGGNGTAASPFPTINAAIQAARPGDVIQVAAGEYRENVAAGEFTNPADTYFSLLGGFSDDFRQRDASKFRSVIDGQGKGPAVRLHLHSDNSTTLDGFRITRGVGLGKTSEDGNGAGGGVFVEFTGNGEVLISHNEIYGNATAGFNDENRGGGIHTDAVDYDGSKPVIRIEDNVIHNNQAGRAAAINATGRDIVILRNMVDANTAHSDHGGGIYISTVVRADVRDNVVRGNQIGKTVNYGWGGGIFIGGGPAALQGNIVTGNYAPTNGSGVFWDEGAKGTMKDDLIFNNGCSSDERPGTALYVDGGAAPSEVSAENLTIAAHNCPFRTGAAILVEAGSKLVVKNSILWDNTDDFATLDNGKFTIENSITKSSGKGNKNADPQFVDPASGNYRLKSGSPASGRGAYP